MLKPPLPRPLCVLEKILIHEYLFQLKEAGVFGVNGVRALNHVGLDHSTGQDPVPGLLLHTVENVALGLASKPGTATIAVVLVRNRF